MELSIFLAIVLRKVHMFFNLHLPMRFYFAKDQGDYSVACDIEASKHYNIRSSKFRLSWCFIKGFLKALFAKKIPDYFIEDWFRPVN
jgi:hypothetical protein